MEYLNHTLGLTLSTPGLVDYCTCSCPKCTIGLRADSNLEKSSDLTLELSLANINNSLKNELSNVLKTILCTVVLLPDYATKIRAHHLLLFGGGLDLVAGGLDLLISTL